ncbi:MAG: GNAT family N-acetyltransferase [Acidobacteria bacterium]|nr:GNAT family N-acetyltransferase [Acidobacteriota bacterium]NIM60869.1 GNAT family N-acetyltransferase [Acidobacteriota bacterium]NIO60403.1 GNAT family N-acetyltransferase [Acidobacteriota bacterium]NIQ31498.1 GNAT family N-acetyltransferase [Acidobacteriota bacterium]NIQ86734.1 GNAT family N-acetyltransferase [Acidobacteriota bacterium]
MALRFQRATLDEPVAQRLIDALNAELEERYPEEGANHFRLDEDEVVGHRGVFLVAYLDDEPVGCGALRRLDARDAEIKRMYVDPATRGSGLGRRLLEELVEQARRLGAQRIVLETGTRQVEALGLYRSAGFESIPRFGEYANSPLSLCLAKKL